MEIEENVFEIDPYKRDILKKVGITILTGEACALSMRLLCELTEKAMELYLEFTGIPVSVENIEKSTWNDRDKYAVFLTHDAITKLVIMAYFYKGFELQEILDKKGNLRFLLASQDIWNVDEFTQSKKRAYGYFDPETGKYIQGEVWDKGRRYTRSEHPRRGLSNVHAMTGMSQ